MYSTENSVVKYCPDFIEDGTVIRYITCYKSEICCPEGCCPQYSFTVPHSVYWWLVLISILFLYYLTSCCLKQCNKRAAARVASQSANVDGNAGNSDFWEHFLYAYRNQNSESNKKDDAPPPDYQEALKMAKLDVERKNTMRENQSNMGQIV